MRISPYLRLAVLLFIALILAVPGFASDPGEAWAATDKIDPALRKQMAAEPGRKLPIIVEIVRPGAQETDRAKGRGNEARASEAATILNSLGKDGKRVGELPVIGSAAGVANATGVEVLSRNPRVAFIHEDSEVRSHAIATAPAVQLEGQPAAPYPFAIGADRVWRDGTTGRGVGVAVLDSGIAPHPDLTRPVNRIVASVNFAGDRQGLPDAGGHGTHVAGIIAGNSTGRDLAGSQAAFAPPGDAGPADFVGVAPGAHLVDVRVLDSQGSGRVSSVVAGIQWVVANKDRYNIRVMNLSIGAPASGSYRQDPLSAAVEMAWKRGIVVVTSAGNGGPGPDGLETPGIDPYSITVGAVEDQGTVAVRDDVWATFTSWGTPLDSTPKPDVVAPGRQVVSLRVPGSYLDRLYPDRVVTGRSGPNYFRLTGTSMSSAVVSGTVALMLERRPRLSPDQVKAILVASAQPYGQDASSRLPDPSADGSGLISAVAAVSASPSGVANRGLRPSDGFARAIYPVIYGQRLTWKDSTYAGIDWSNLAWDNLVWDSLAWDNLAWDNLAWDNLAWDNLAWDNLAWDNLAWDSAPGDSRGRLGGQKR